LPRLGAHPIFPIHKVKNLLPRADNEPTLALYLHCHPYHAERLERQNAWPNVFRTSRFIHAVEYIQANRSRYQIIQDIEKLMTDINVYIAPSFGGHNLLLTNLTSHHCVVLPNGFDGTNHPVSISFIGRLFDEATLLAVARAYQQATDFHTQHPAYPRCLL